ncbi:MAG: ceramidase domain-containing protein [Acidimicrobiia bacterium]
MARRPLVIACAALAAFGVAFAVAGSDGWGPAAENESAIGEISRWCERVSGGLLREPANTLGNLGFVIAGLAMFGILGRDIISGRERVNPFIGHTPIVLLYASASVFLGPGSMVMHGTHTRFGAWIDNVSMVAYILIPWLFNLSRLGRWRDRTLFATYGGLLGVYAAGYWFVGPDLGIGLDLFGASIGLWVVSEVVYRFWSPAVRWLSGFVGFMVAAAFGVTPATILEQPGRYWWVVLFWLPGFVARYSAPDRRRYVPWYWVGVMSFLGAYAIWLTGTADHPACDPDTAIQAHAIWHLLSAVATFAFFLFLRTARPIARQPELDSSSSTASGSPSS